MDFPLTLEKIYVIMVKSWNSH